ncbi:hypothetical protein T484DRAFT_1829505 [Baffinella frigidus]|nr:hypothetical protein T484DRAFT_1829505 [Cryptophyta sp. CCMP2293]
MGGSDEDRNADGGKEAETGANGKIAGVSATCAIEDEGCLAMEKGATRAWNVEAAEKKGWKKHKKTCAPPLSLDDVQERLRVASDAHDWQEVLKWEGRMDELMEEQSDTSCNLTLCQFSWAYSVGARSTGSQHHALSEIRLQKRQVELLGKMERFRDQGEKMCILAIGLEDAGRKQEAGAWYQKARDVGAAHGFFSVECQACLGLGKLAIDEGRDEEGLDLLRNAAAASPLSEDEDSMWEIPVLHSLIDALFKTDAIDELEPLIPRYREAAEAAEAKEGRLSAAELHSCYFRARLHEAMATGSA